MDSKTDLRKKSCGPWLLQWHNQFVESYKTVAAVTGLTRFAESHCRYFSSEDWPFQAIRTAAAFNQMLPAISTSNGKQVKSDFRGENALAEVRRLVRRAAQTNHKATFLERFGCWVTGTIKKRFDSIGVENTEANRAAYRDLLFTSKGIGSYISGAILFEETLFQKSPSGTSMVQLLKNEGIIPGIKVDKGLATLPGTDDEKATMGLDGLSERCKKYYEAGARFAKWRAVLSIDPAKGKPTNLSITEVAHGLARYAAICQANRLVPIVEPEILTDGSHDITVCAEVTERV
ncbi:putative fructose-bisphosphate aldolase, partial [Toxoplasma gondii GAB2-2007-GAL-DOM2]